MKPNETRIHTLAMLYAGKLLNNPRSHGYKRNRFIDELVSEMIADPKRRY